MKKLILGCMLIIGSTALADGVDLRTLLPDEGRDCVWKSTYYEVIECGEPVYVSFTCRETAGEETREVGYLIVGTWESDVHNTCSPVIYPINVIRERR